MDGPYHRNDCFTFCFQVYQCLLYLLEKGANCDIIPEEVPHIPHDKTWSEAFEHKIMQQEGRSVCTYMMPMSYSTILIKTKNILSLLQT